MTKYYKTQDEPRRVSGTPERDYPVPIPPVITSPVRPGSPGLGNERPPQFQPSQPDSRSSDRSGQSSIDQLFASQPEPQSVQPRPSTSSGRQTESFTFNNVYEGSAASVQSNEPAQSVAPTIPVVMQRQFAEYGQRYQQADFLHRLPPMHLPTLPEGHYRAFEAGDDFTFPGALLVGKFTRNWFDIADGKLYVLLIHQQPTGAGIYCRRVYNQVKVKGSLLLTADRADLPNRETALKDVLEVWEVCAFVSQMLPPPVPNTERLRQLVDELRFEVERL